MKRSRINRLATTVFASAICLSAQNPAQAQPIVMVEQGADWTDHNRQLFYTTDQGSRIMPLAWMQALTHPDGTPFLADELTRYGYLKNPATPGLPVGFTTNDFKGVTAIGMTCAACHTRQIEVDGTEYRLDGGPGIVDFQSFLADIDTAMGRVVNDGDAFDAFARDVLGAGASGTDKATLRIALETWYLRYHTLMERALPADPWGPSRLDAVSMIFNRLSGLDIGPEPTYLIPENIQPADAPVRYPFLWNAARQDKTQWPGFSDNGNAILGLARNLGEVYGVSAEFHPHRKSGFLLSGVNYIEDNSANFDGLKRVEDLIWKIGAPKWPWQLDDDLVQTGKEIFDRGTDAGGCVDCHGIKKGAFRSFSHSTWKTPIQNVGTDARECEILNRVVKTGILEGEQIPFVGTPLPAEAPAFDVLATSVLNSILQHTLGFFSEEALESVGEDAGLVLPHEVQYLQGAFDRMVGEQMQESNAGGASCAYEARVMQGIWAAAPYLHNGSVRSLEDLLKPAGERAKSFRIGPAYDIESVGLAAEQTVFDYTLETTGCDQINSGSSNCGHEFGTSLPADEKRALLEYLKSL